MATKDGIQQIDPALQDAVQTSQPPQEYRPSAGASPNSVRLPLPSSHLAYHEPPQPPQHVQHEHQQQHHPQQYTPYPQEASYNHGFYGHPPGHQYGQNAPPDGYQPIPPPPQAQPAAAPAHHYVSSRGSDAKRLRACEACRGLKVRCEPDLNGGACKRCIKAGRKCEITPPSRKRQKKTDNRVSELEKQLADIQAQLKMGGQTGDDSEGEQYEDASSMQIDMAESSRQQPFASQQSPFASHSSTGQKQSHVEINRNRAAEARMYDLPQPQDSNTHHNGLVHPPMPHSLDPAEHTVNAQLGSIAKSMDDTQLATNLMSEYIEMMVPQKPTISTTFAAHSELLQRSKPVLFVAIMMLMLQSRCRSGGKASASSKNETPEKGNQALHLLSEVAMGNKGAPVDRSPGQADAGELAATHLLENPANLLVQKLLGLSAKDLQDEDWFEEVIRDFH